MKILLTGNSSYKVLHFRRNIIEELKRSGYELYLLAPKDEYTHQCDELGVKYIRLNLSRNGKNIFVELFLIIKIFFVILKLRPDVVLSFTIKNNKLH